MPPPSLPSLAKEYKDNVFKYQASSSTVPNFERLAFIGASVIQFNITHYLHNHLPKNSPSDLHNKLHKAVTRKPAAWGKLYKLHSHCSKPSMINLQNSSNHDLASSAPISQRSDDDLFHAYVGGLFLEFGGEKGNGFQKTNQWIKAILDYEKEEGRAESGDDDDEQAMKSKPTSRQKYTNPPSTPTQPLPKAAGSRGATTTGENGGNHPTSLLNELVMKEKRQLSWDDSSSGLPHSSVWTVKLKVSGSEKVYTGTGSSKKEARSVAAESALKVLSRQS